ncbi:hypothetical protein U9M48_000262 [Paspalum notatum var. saurae]|uniref:NB-ARC domain-containing protein n=1 Tax=Paspalum notatum var. saurae TaxID=547442 RepID=A0AAQ3PL45_PASNO
MDGVWSERAWNDVLSVPVRNASRKQPGSRVLVTTRSAHLPQQMQAQLHKHRVRPLHQNDAWSLLKKQLQPAQVVGIDEQLKNIGMEILKKCDGLPLAVKVVGGLLSTRYPSEHEWKAVLDKPAWSQAGLPAELDSRLYLSYEDLTPQLRQCFLYCSLFPKGQVIHQGTVTSIWVSEGFIEYRPVVGNHLHEYGLEEMATEYYRELIKRNLIEPTEIHSLTGYSCTMHDVVHSFAEYMAREESLLVVDKEQMAATAGGRGGGMLVRRLSIAQIVSVGEWAILQRQESLRTLIIDSGVDFKPSVSFGHYFSSLRDTDISRLPDDIHKMKFLRTVPKEIGGLTNLRIFLGFPVHVDMDAGNTRCSLEELAPLSRLRILEICGLEKVSASCMAEKAMISTKGHLSYLELNYNTTVEHTAEPRGLIIKDVPSVKRVGPEFQAPSSLAFGASTATLAPFPKLKELKLDGLPKWGEWEWNDFEEEQGGIKATIAMRDLEKLYISNFKLSRLPPGLANSKRLALRVLYMYKLTNITALENFPSVVQLDVFDCPELKRISGLSKLQKISMILCPSLLVLEGVTALDNMVLEDGGMEALPDYLAVVNPRYLELRCCKKLHKALSPGSSEWKKIGHIRKHNIICIKE